MYRSAVGFSKSLQSYELKQRRHDEKYLCMTIDYKIPISIEEFDKLTEKRIDRMIEIQRERMELQNRRMDEERREAERLAARKAIMRK